ncbi:hypothetical protein BZG36_03791 [Bifiguratus adelaidae]|uniref:NmrA-like domain-containing protein n=1 Tax=Bifiguratus adelaidae TaxID=1938954 RepID=A0A261XWX3_9FUNG|nr:hypothetical protein BZG36_03791 [Bifiguratus adelaidae]
MFGLGRDSPQAHIRVIGRDKRALEDLKRLGAEVMQVDYENQESVEAAMRSCDWVIIVPDDDASRVDHGRRVIDAAQSARVQNCILLSLAAVDRGRQKNLQYIAQYGDLEDHVKQKFQQGRYCIVRNDFFQQYLYLWIAMMQRDKTIRMSLRDGDKFAPVNVEDIGHALLLIVMDKRDDINMMIANHQQVLHFTGPKVMTVKDLVEKLNRSVRDMNMSYSETSRDDLRQYLQALRREEDARYMRSMARNEEDDPSRPQIEHLTDAFIETMLDVFELIKTGSVNIVTDELEKILGRKPMDISDFFTNHREDFDPNMNRK